jgi:phosphopentomutase
MAGPGGPAGFGGLRTTFADVGATLAAHLGLPPTWRGAPMALG